MPDQADRGRERYKTPGILMPDQVGTGRER